LESLANNKTDERNLLIPSALVVVRAQVLDGADLVVEIAANIVCAACQHLLSLRCEEAGLNLQHLPDSTLYVLQVPLHSLSVQAKTSIRVWRAATPLATSALAGAAMAGSAPRAKMARDLRETIVLVEA
jgi:hypothetical protein